MKGVDEVANDQVPAAPTRPATFDEFCVAIYPRLLRLGYVLTGSQHAAQELAQETALRAFRHWDRVAGMDDAQAWTRRVLVNLATSRGRRLTLEARGLVKLRGDRTGATHPALERTDVLDAIRALPKRQAQAIALFYFDDLALADVARVMECPENTVKNLLRHCRQGLGEVLRHDEELT